MKEVKYRLGNHTEQVDDLDLWVERSLKEGGVLERQRKLIEVVALMTTHFLSNRPENLELFADIFAIRRENSHEFLEHTK